eukprot:1178581-Prorocentrum_minimum.AAC.1
MDGVAHTSDVVRQVVELRVSTVMCVHCNAFGVERPQWSEIPGQLTRSSASHRVHLSASRSLWKLPTTFGCARCTPNRLTNSLQTRSPRSVAAFHTYRCRTRKSFLHPPRISGCSPPASEGNYSAKCNKFQGEHPSRIIVEFTRAMRHDIPLPNGKSGGNR